MPPVPRQTSHSKRDCTLRSDLRRQTGVLRKSLNAVPWRSVPLASKKQSFALDIFKETRIRVRVRMLPFAFPDRQRLNVYVCFEQHLESDICHLDRRIHELAARTVQ